MPQQSILLVDDNADNLALLAQLLQKAGYQVRAANSGKLALASLHHTPADLIMLDICMPQMDGYAVCRALKENPQTKEIPVIFLSALNEPLDKIKAFESGGVDFITKPFHKQEVLARVRNHLQLHALQQQLIRHNEELEAEVLRRTASLRESNAALENALKAKKEFLMLMSHEFRTPLHGILGLTEILQNDVTDSQRECVLDIKTNAQKLLKLVDTVLQVALQASGEMPADKPHPALDMHKLCSTLLQRYATCAAQKQITLSLQVDAPPRLDIPPGVERMSEIIGNLLDNALKFTPNGGKAGIRVFYLPDENKILIEVWDTGPGIPPAERQRIFEPFVQLEPLLSRHHEGAGLGLTLARNLVELHGGTIQVAEQVPPPGSVFSVLLPAKPAPEAPTDSRPDEAVGDHCPAA